MGNRVENILNSVKKSVSQEVFEKVTTECGQLDGKSTTAKQARHITFLMDNLKSYCTSDEIIKIMQPCGYHCCSDSTVEKARKLFTQSTDMAEFLSKLNQHRIGGGNLHIKGNCIIGVYDKCYCGIAKTAKNLSSDYCDCSAGWFKKLFSCVLDRDIKVKRQKTILDRAKECTFKIYAL